MAVKGSPHAGLAPCPDARLLYAQLGPAETLAKGKRGA
jgi:hypothetical protein